MDDGREREMPAFSPLGKRKREEQDAETRLAEIQRRINELESEEQEAEALASEEIRKRHNAEGKIEVLEELKALRNEWQVNEGLRRQYPDLFDYVNAAISGRLRSSVDEHIKTEGALMARKNQLRKDKEMFEDAAGDLLKEIILKRKKSEKRKPLFPASLFLFRVKLNSLL